MAYRLNGHFNDMMAPCELSQTAIEVKARPRQSQALPRQVWNFVSHFFLALVSAH